MSKFAKKIIFNISQHDLDRMTEMRGKLDLDQSTYIRQAICMYTAEQKIEEFRRGDRYMYACASETQ